MKVLLAHILISISTFIGIVLGKLSSFFPRLVKLAIAQGCAWITHHTYQKVFFIIYPCIYEWVKWMYFPSRYEVKIVKKMPKGYFLDLDITKKTQRHMFLSPLYEPHISHFLIHTLKKDQVFINIGANIGYYTLLAARCVGDQGKVIAFEPEQSNFVSLIHNIKKNNSTMIMAEHKAVGSESGMLTLNINPLNEGGHSLNAFETYSDNNSTWSKEKITALFPHIPLTQNVEVVSLDEYLKNISLNQVDCILIDVEGFEYEVLKGMKYLLASEHPPRIICEISGHNDELVALMAENGYKAYTFDQKGNTYIYDMNNGLKSCDYLFQK